jgi:hypothetical protein
MTGPAVDRRDLILSSLLGAFLPMTAAHAGALDAAQTQITLPSQILWKSRKNFPPDSVASADLFGDLKDEGIYYELIKWFPGYMSAPHTYVTDRLCVVVSGIWWANSGADFDPSSCQPVPAGSFVRRVAHTPHYDGVIASGKEPAVIAICGIAPAGMRYVDASKPGWRKVG